MLAHLHILLPKGTGDDGRLFRGQQVCGGESAKQFVVQVLHRFRRIQRSGTVWPAVALFQRLLGLDVRHGQALFGGKCGILGKVLAQGLIDLTWAGVLAFDPVGVVRIHVAQQATQLRRHAGAGKQGGHAGQIMCLG